MNYGLALLRAGQTERGIAELEKAQKTDATIPHTWFNLGVYLRKQGKQDEALAQFRGMERLVPDEPVTHYQIGSILKTKGDLDGAIKEFEIAQHLNAQLAAPHFQLYGLVSPEPSARFRRGTERFSGISRSNRRALRSRGYGMERLRGDLRSHQPASLSCACARRFIVARKSRTASPDQRRA